MVGTLDRFTESTIVGTIDRFIMLQFSNQAL